MQMESLAEDYRFQTDRLDALSDERGQVASPYMIARERRSGRPRSMTSWTRGVPSYLPRTDIIVFSRVIRRRNGATLAVIGFFWDQAVPVIGDLMKPLDMYPPRYEVTEFPTNKQFDAMGEPIPPNTFRSL
jgi:hypothetical protein